MTDIKQLAKVLRSFDLSRLEYEKDGLRIVLERNAPIMLQPLESPEAEPASERTPLSAVEKDTL